MIILLDAGHGGIIQSGNNKYYLTPGKRSPEVPPGIYEGEFNRRIAELTELCLMQQCIPVVQLNPGPINIPLSSRVSFVNQVHAKEPCALVSIHANASPEPGWSDAQGTVLFVAERASDQSWWLAENLAQQLNTGAWPLEFRKIKERNLTMVARTKCPAVLIEAGFMTNKFDAMALATYRVQWQLASILSDVLADYVRNWE